MSSKTLVMLVLKFKLDARVPNFEAVVYLPHLKLAALQSKAINLAFTLGEQKIARLSSNVQHTLACARQG